MSESISKDASAQQVCRAARCEPLIHSQALSNWCNRIRFSAAKLAVRKKDFGIAFVLGIRHLCDRCVAPRQTMEAELAARQFSAHAILNELHVPVTAICDAISQLHAQIRQADEDAQQERIKHGASDPSAASPDDVLLLNVGGSEWRVKRKLLTQGEGVEGTLLAALCSGCWDGRLVRDDKQRVFLNMDSEAFRAIHKAILDAETMRTSGKAASVKHLIDDAAKRNQTGPHDFWVKLMMSPLDKTTPAEATSSGGAGTDLRLPTTGIPAEMGDTVKRLEGIMKAFAAEKARLEGQLRAANTRRDHLNKEIQAVEPFLLPLSGGDHIRSVDACGQVISTTQSTVDTMNQELINRFDMWPGPVDVVQPDHISRIVDHHRRQRLGASPAEANVPLQMDTAREQAAFDINAAMYGVVKTDTPHGAQQTSDSDGFTSIPFGDWYRIVTEGSGRVPTLNDSVRYDWIAWCDAFDGQRRVYDRRGWVYRVSDMGGWLREAVLSMRVGEVRQIKLPDDYIDRYAQLRLISIE
ncbi:unnamed protein product [Vitrella brassicaformis CCMP3155]|uniref:Potassium channel tetramerisation-type BTB domain-containing protein n=1 Tax=Vitrella brassicaformis (strain CCMP3155) TaxID=1169540 RepID=A0A0G4H4P7_VITBC|nr:unnamed protein product [Vitrella brassicaformis CCMP3155]|eukprot:CEM38756.1 unnamed protein product [Vitrella brassicaformis CCMP3155]